MTTNLTTNNKRTRHEYTKDEITPVLAFRIEGYTYTKISNITKIPISTVRWLVKKHAKDSCAKLRAPNRRGKDKGLSRRDVSALTRNLLRDRRQSLDQLAQYGNGVQLLEMYQCHMSLTSVYRHKYLLILYLSRIGKKTKRRSNNKSIKAKT